MTNSVVLIIDECQITVDPLKQKLPNRALLLANLL